MAEVLPLKTANSLKIGFSMPPCRRNCRSGLQCPWYPVRILLKHRKSLSPLAIFVDRKGHLRWFAVGSGAIFRYELAVPPDGLVRSISNSGAYHARSVFVCTSSQNAAIMTISMTEYFRTRKADRKKETRYLNVINKDSCTSCNSCASVCPVDCIYEVVSPIPSQSYHQIDTSRCIGCQMCYRSPNDSTDLYTLTICPWNAIDMLHNPNVKPDEQSVFEPYYRGESTDLPWPKLEEYGYQLFLDGEVFIPADDTVLQGYFSFFQQLAWMYSEEDNVRIVAEETEAGEGFVRFQATEEGRDLLDVVFDGYQRIFMD